MFRFIATIHVVLRAKDESEAADYLSEIMRNLQMDQEIADWNYACFGKQLLSPTQYVGPIPMEDES